LLTSVIGIIASPSVVRRLERFRRDADALAAGTGEPIRLQGTDDIDQAAAIFNEMHSASPRWKARQVNEEELIAAKRYADNVINSMFDVLIVTDPELRIRTVNKAACDLLEYTELELVGPPGGDAVQGRADVRRPADPRAAQEQPDARLRGDVPDADGPVDLGAAVGEHDA
jgi:PAS domain-containing protein